VKSKSYSTTETVIVLSAGWLLLYAARTVLSATLKSMGDFWGLSETFLGVISSGFFVAYTILQMPSGFLADRFGSKKVLLTGFVLQSFAVFFSAFAQNEIQFLIARVLAGTGQATYFACQHAIINMTVPAERKALATSATVAGSALGTALGFVLGRLLCLGHLGWRFPFVVLGIVSISFIWAIIFKVPEPRKSPEFVQSYGEGKVVDFAREPSTVYNWMFLVCFCLSHFLTMYGFYLMLTWLPYYLETVKGYTGNLAAIIPIVMPVVMAPAAILGGYISDRIGSKRLILNLALPLSAMATIAIPILKSSRGLLGALALYGATGKLVIDPALITYVADSAPVKLKNTILSIFNFAGALAMAAAPFVTGFLADITGSFKISFYMAGVFNIVAQATFIAGLKILRPSHLQSTES